MIFDTYAMRTVFRDSDLALRINPNLCSYKIIHIKLQRKKYKQ